MKFVLNYFKKYKILRFLFSGGVGALSQVIFLFIFVEYLHVWYILGTSIAFVFSVIVSYLMHKIFTFNDSSPKYYNQIFKFFLFQIIMFFLNIFWMYLFVDVLNILYILAQIISSGINAFISYFILNNMIFKKPGI